MNSLWIVLMLSTFSTSFSLVGGNDEDVKLVQLSVQSFVKAADERNTKRLDEVMHDECRVVLNRQFGSKELSIINKALYLQLIQEEKLGGDQRAVHFCTPLW
ncbi:MAG: hypothetical protein HC912_05575 [Saprospiraceae bacterium]|nr:hypothetical protein [Saprospiraceae bacterium]